MKKLVFIIAIIAVVAGFAVSYAVSYPELGDLRNIEPMIAASPEPTGGIYLLEYNGGIPFVYRVNSKGTVTAAHKSSERITFVAAHGENVYLLKEDVSYNGKWKLFEISGDLSSSSLREVCVGDYSLLSRVTSLTSTGSGLYISGVSADGLSAYSLKWSDFPQDKEFAPPEIDFTVNAPIKSDESEQSAQDYIVSASSAGNDFYVTFKSGRTALAKRQGDITLLSPTSGMTTALSASDYGFAFYDSSENRLWCGQGGNVSSEVFGALKGVQATLPVERGAYVLATAETGSTILLFNSGELGVMFERLKIPFNLQVSLLRFPAFSTVALQLVLALLLIISLGFLLFSHQIANRATACFAFALSVLLTIATAAGSQNISSVLTSSRIADSAVRGGYVSTFLDGFVYPYLQEPDFYDTAEFSELSSRVGDSVDSVLVFVDADNVPRSVMSEEYAYGLPAANIYSGKVMGAIQTVIETQDSRTLIHNGYAVSVVPCFYGGRVSALIVTSVPITDIHPLVSQVYDDYLRNGLVLVLSLVLLMYLLNNRLTKPLRKIINKMGRYAHGDFETDNKSSSYGDAGVIERALSEMGMSLAINEYETKAMVNSFYRFVPRGIENLLDRANITEITNGDMASVRDNLCMLSVDNAVDAQAVVGDNGFMTFVSDCFAQVHEQVQKQNGMMLSGDFNLSALPILFPAAMGAASGIRFGLDLIGAGIGESGFGQRTGQSRVIPLTVESNKGNEKSLDPDFFMILHNTKFLYGIAGSDEKAFPFLSSCELNFLNSYSSRLRALGSRIVMTEQYCNSLKESSTPINFSARFIGFLSSNDKRYSYNIYELLDCYPDNERIMRVRYDEKFQKAIRLFFKNDFYLARSEFSAILRSNPNDGVAKWYIFACEYFFNMGDLSKVSYNLFEIDDE
ncbi:MAG: hypothetical protein FWG83_01160 [Oscillospiraceae bacterium]|nr:hypothetical protein [Oscillospiraceae bacterium]